MKKMAYKVVVARSFENDLRKVLSCYAELPNAAKKLIAELEKAHSVLEEMPELNAPMRFVSEGSVEYRRYLVKQYSLVYRIEGDKVYLLRLFHQSQDYERVLAGQSNS